MKYLFIFCLFLFGCGSMVPGEGADVELGEISMRHGWSSFAESKRTVIDVNDENSIGRGRNLYQKNCQACHGNGGKGDGPLAKAKGIKPANLTMLSRQAPNYFLFMQIQEGKGEMPRWKDVLTAQESWDLTNYIQSLKGQ